MLDATATSAGVSGLAAGQPCEFSIYSVGANGASATVDSNRVVVLGNSTSQEAPPSPDAWSSSYWLVGSDGGVFAYGQATFDGSPAGRHLNKRAVGIAATPSGNGYWLAASDGGVFAYGDGAYFGSLAGHTLNKHVVGIAAR